MSIDPEVGKALMAEDNTMARLVTLTDGVLSIAMTLLVLDIRLAMPADKLSNGELWQAILAIQPQIWSYCLSFLVIAVFWINHAQKFRHLSKLSNLLVWLNVLFLLGVGMIPFTTSILAENGNAVSTAIYAGVMAFASLMLGLMSLYARIAGLADEAIDKGRLGLVIISQFSTVAVFAVSIGVAFVNAEWAKYCWLLLIPFGFISRRNPKIA